MYIVNERSPMEVAKFRLRYFAEVATERAWILMTMKVAATAAQATPPRLAFFQSDVLGMARCCDKLAAASPVAEQRKLRKRVVDLWSLFPCFCRSPSDIEAAMPKMTATLSRALEDKRYPELLVLLYCPRSSGMFIIHTLTP